MKYFSQLCYVAALLLLVGMLDSCKKEPVLSSEASILSFSFANPSATGTISSTSIAVEVPFGTDVTKLSPTITVSDRATISPASGLTRDFSNPVTYIVTAEDGVSEKSYTVTVKILDPKEVVISAFEVAGAVSVAIDQTAKTITINMLEGANVKTLSPKITTIPAGATVSPGSNIVQDFTNPVTYKVTQGATTASYTASVKFVAYGLNFKGSTIRFDAATASSTLVPEMATTGDNERGFSMNSTHVFMADKGENQVFFYKNDGTSASAGTLKKTDAAGAALVAGGIFGLSDVVATEKGIIACNMNWAGGAFRVYRWANTTAPAELLLSFPATFAGSNLRLGDNINFSGDPFGNGKLYVIPFPGSNSIANNNYVLVWNIANGAVTNAANPTQIVFKDLIKAGNYGYVEPVSADGKNYLLVNGAEMVPTLYSEDGATKFTAIATDAIGVRTHGGKIFEINNARYLAMALPGSEGSTVRDAGLVVYDITGGTLVEAMNALTAEAVRTKLVFTSSIGNKINGNTAADVSVYLNTAAKKVWMMAGAANNGFRVVEAVATQ
ncbi:MAG: DUF4623 domain-containing protein [Saprospiraceae bacterium]|jgi:hypothetical protein